MKLLNKDKRSLLMSLLLGDGCLHRTGKFVADHGIQQADYVAWKAELLSDIFGRNYQMMTGHKGNSVQVQACDRRMRSWYKFVYKDNKKSIPRILRFIQNPEMALAIWLMDDGYVESSISKLSDGTKKNYGARFRLFTCDQSEENQLRIISWFKENFNADLKVKYMHDKRTNKTYPFLKINGEDSLRIWHIIRTWILKFKSMQIKFRHIEQIYQYRILQRNTD